MSKLSKTVENAEWMLAAAIVWHPQNAESLLAGFTDQQITDRGALEVIQACRKSLEDRGRVEFMHLAAGGVSRETLDRLLELEGAAMASSGEHALMDFLGTSEAFSLSVRLRALGQELERGDGRPEAVASILDELGLQSQLGRERMAASVLECPDLIGWPEWIAEVQDEEARSVCSWGIRELDERLKGLRPGSLHILVGATGAGKSTIALNASIATARRGGRVLYVSLEMGHSEMHARIVANVQGQPVDTVEAWIREDNPRIEGALRESRTLGLEIDPRSDTIAKIRRRVIDAKLRGVPYDLVVIDYLQLLQDPGRDGEAQRLSEIANSAKRMATVEGCAVLAPVQTSRSAEPGVAPQLSDIKGSSGIEQAADSVVAFNRSAANDRLNIVIRKVRNGMEGGLESRPRFCGPSFQIIDDVDGVLERSIVHDG